jgi:tRNA (guanine-N7-)-methyltransferase
MDPIRHRRVRSFVRRPGRITASQQRALQQLWPQFGIEYREARLDLDAAFERTAPRALDIGFGDGEALITMAARSPDVDFLGVEVHEPGIGHLLVMLERAQLTNVRIIAHDVVDVIDHMLEPAGFDVINIFFPDPWPKKRHHKRRLISDAFMPRLAAIAKPGALLHLATDWQPYAEAMLEVISRNGEFAAIEQLPADLIRLAERPPTKFERRGQRLGHHVVDFYYRKIAAG